MSLQVIFDDFKSKLPEELQPILFGPNDHPDDHRSLPTMTWRPARRDHTTPHGLGPMFTGLWTIEVDIWGRDLTDTEQLVNAFLATAHDTLGKAGYAPGGEVWPRVGPTANGARCLLSFRLATAIPKTVEPTRPITEVVAKYRMNVTEFEQPHTPDEP